MSVDITPASFIMINRDPSWPHVIHNMWRKPPVGQVYTGGNIVVENAGKMRLTVEYDHLTRCLFSYVYVIKDGKKIRCLAQWDTGAMETNISPRVVDALGLIPFDKQDYSTPGGDICASAYRVCIELSEGMYANDLVVHDAATGYADVDVLIGMDIIGCGDFAVSNYGGKTTFTFRAPSCQKIDFRET